ncbi:PfkB family carbohydrate kinase [Sanguibacter sp. Z1732]|uniref:PfkB family carbohydrate kinase n=1 Tax=Sanguibacter sp. Z1732 TaxID=3435412 RepID=UPI003D9C9E31
MSGIDVLTLGETMGTIRAEGTLGVGPEPRISIAGAESNVAIGLARLGHRSAWSSVLGSDAIGDLIVRTLAAERVDTTAVRREQGAPSGILVSQQRPMGRARVATTGPTRLSPRSGRPTPGPRWTYGRESCT